MGKASRRKQLRKALKQGGGLQERILESFPSVSSSSSHLIEKGIQAELSTRS